MERDRQLEVGEKRGQEVGELWASLMDVHQICSISRMSKPQTSLSYSGTSCGWPEDAPAYKPLPSLLKALLRCAQLLTDARPHSVRTIFGSLITFQAPLKAHSETLSWKVHQRTKRTCTFSYPAGFGMNSYMNNDYPGVEWEKNLSVICPSWE